MFSICIDVTSARKYELDLIAAKEKAQELGTTIKTTIGEAKDKVSEKLEPVKKGVSSLKDAIVNDNHGRPRNWKETIKNQKDKLVRKIRWGRE